MFLFDSPNTAAGTHVGERMAEAPRAGSDWLIPEAAPKAATADAAEGGAPGSAG
jgi:hypothetical protein